MRSGTGALFRRAAMPAIAFLAGLGFQIGGYQSQFVAWILWGVAGVWALVAIVTWEPVTKWLPRATVTWPALQQARPEAKQVKAETSIVAPEKGFLDFRLDLQRAAEELPKVLLPLTKETAAIGDRIRRHAERWPNVQEDARKSHKVASHLADDINRYCVSLERRFETLKETGAHFTGGMIGLLSTAPVTHANREELRDTRPAVKELHSTVRKTRENIAGFRNRTSGVRELRVSQRLNAATDRLAADLEELIRIMKDIEDGAAKTLKMIDDLSNRNG